jgi:hypothetical protein
MMLMLLVGSRHDILGSSSISGKNQCHLSYRPSMLGKRFFVMMMILRMRNNKRSCCWGREFGHALLLFAHSISFFCIGNKSIHHQNERDFARVAVAPPYCQLAES